MKMPRKYLLRLLFYYLDKSGEVVDFFLNLEQFQNMTKKGADSLFAQKGIYGWQRYSGKFSSFYER